MSKNNSAVDPFIKQLSVSGDYDSDNSYDQQFKDFLLRYYIGISDFRGEGLLVDCGLPRRIEKYLSLYGKVLAIELTENKIVLARLTGELKRNFLDGSIVKCDFIMIDDDTKEKYQVRTVSKTEGKKKVKKL